MFKLHDYQQSIFDEVTQELYLRQLVSAATGSGKSVIMSELNRHYIEAGQSVLTLVHRDQLINQLADTMGKQIDTPIGYIKAGKPSNRHTPFQLGSVQSLGRRQLPFIPDVIILDECHTTTFAKVVRDLFDSLPITKFIGFTATPMSTSKKRQLVQYYNHAVVAPTPNELMNMGRLAKDIYFVEESLTKEELKSIRINSFGEWNSDDLAGFCDRDDVIEQVVRDWKKHAKGRRTVCFGVNVAHSKHLADAFNRAGIPAAHIDGTMPVRERKIIYDKLTSGEILVLCNCQVLIEGFDVPAISCVILARPDRSIANYIQKVGRGLRASKGKVDCYIIDRGGNYQRHGAIRNLLREDYLLKPYKKFEPQECPTKACPECGAVILNFAQKCENCGYVFPKKFVQKEIEDLVMIDPIVEEPVFEITTEEKKTYYQETRRLSYIQNHNPTRAYAQYKTTFGEDPKREWNHHCINNAREAYSVTDTAKDYCRWIADWTIKLNKDIKFYRFQIQLEYPKIDDLTRAIANYVWKERSKQSQLD